MRRPYSYHHMLLIVKVLDVAIVPTNMATKLSVKLLHEIAIFTQLI